MPEIADQSGKKETFYIEGLLFTGAHFCWHGLQVQ
jgi:hypothetical protein